jgi:hypothetical protein
MRREEERERERARIRERMRITMIDRALLLEYRREKEHATREK